MGVSFYDFCFVQVGGEVLYQRGMERPSFTRTVFRGDRKTLLCVEQHNNQRGVLFNTLLCVYYLILG